MASLKYYCLVAVMIWLCLDGMVNGQAGTFGFHLNGVSYSNGSTVLRTDIGEGDAALQCTTDSTTCCSNIAPEMRGGEFYFPDDTLVPIMLALSSQGYYRNRGSQLIRLNRWANGTNATTGLFRCEIPAASGTTVSLFVSIVDIKISIAPHGNSTVGGRYSLECSVAVNGSAEPTNLTWLSPLNTEVPPAMVNTAGNTSTLTFDPLSLSHAGTYTCRVVLGGIEERRTQTVVVDLGVSLSLRGTPLPNNSYVYVNDIGEGGTGGASDAEGVLCLTNKQDCCGASQVGGDPLGQWFFPDGSMVDSRSNNIASGRADYFFRNRFQSVVRLLRVGQPDEQGLFRCEVPNAFNVNQTLYVNVVDVIPTPTSATFLLTTTFGPSPTPTTVITVNITSSGSIFAGGVLNLKCSALVVAHTGQPTIMWLHGTTQDTAVGGDATRVTVSPVTVNTNGHYSRSLLFNPLVASDAGLFTCRVMLEGVTEIETISVTVNDSVLQLSDSGGSPLLGQSYTLTCNVVESVNFSYTFQWRKDGLLLNKTGKILSFSQLQLSDAGQYNCETIGTVTVTSSALNVSLQVPTPEILVTSSSATPYNGTIFNLTGTIQLNTSIVDIDIAATWQWSLGEMTLLEETSSSPLQSVLSFLPLATNSSGEYRLSVTLAPLANSSFIVQSNDSHLYNLSVLPLPSRPPSIGILSRQPSADDFCGEATTLNCTAYPVDGLFSPPIIRWIDYRGNEVAIGGNNNPRVENQTKKLIFNDVTTGNRGMYTCRIVINIPIALINNYFDESNIVVNTTFPGQVKNLTCAESSSSNMLNLSWKHPTFLGNEVVDYRVEVKQLQHKTGTREVMEIPITDSTTVTEPYIITQGLDPEVPYKFVVKARNLAGCGEEEQVYCFTQEGVPPTPINVTLVRFNSTTIGVHWVKFTLVELKGLAIYFVTYDIIISSRKRVLGGSVSVPWTNNSLVISNLQAGAQYRVSVQTLTSAGMSVPAEVRTENGAPTGVGNPDTIVAIVCGIVAVVIILAVTAIIIAALRFALKIHRRKSLNLRDRSINSPFMVENEFYEPSKDTLARIDIVDHTYDTVDKYNKNYVDHPAAQPYEEIKPRFPQTQLSCNTYGFAACPLYASATFDDVTDGKQTAETSFSQNVCAADDSVQTSTTNEEERYVTTDFDDSRTDDAYATVH